ncbi:histidine kinase [Brunnivagina elsteri]|uniref:Histidine kinase n=1 Tax=Brunnivagina elsteri CCALA 953 TaxID=987040 RepID=A0A2A2TFG0_9CYAN|nr:histidine kinase [Calothrix elsteri]PAX52368.1 histidine kinase [Calothrix elsteri CCALA 953]
MLQNIGKIPSFKLGKNQVITLLLFLGFVAFFLSLMVVNLSSNSHMLTWKKAEEITPQPLLKIVLSQKHARYINVSSIQVMRVPSHGAGDLYIFDFRSFQLCGAGGCLYSIYNKSGKLILEFIANPLLPEKENLIQVSDTVNQGFPCLIINQSISTSQLLSKNKFCYQDGRYFRLNQDFTTE